MTFLFDPGRGNDLPLLAQAEQQKHAALAQAGLAAVQYIHTRAAQDYAAMRFAVCRFETYAGIANELGGAR